MIQRIVKVIIVSFLLLAANSVWAAAVIAIRASALSDRSRVVFDLSSQSQHHVFLLKNPQRLVVDLKHTFLKTKLQQQSNSIIKDIRSSQQKGFLRIVFDLKKAISFKAFTLHAEGPQHNRLVIDLIAEHNHINAKPVVVLPKNKKLRKVIIVIDPGHGGKDPGATGLRGTHEKNVVLAIAKDLQRLLDKQYGFKAELTRTGDYFIPLRGRLRILRRDHGDMFIAIHADAYKNHEARGASVFALSESGATSEAARWLARKENESELGHTLANLSYKNQMLRSVLIDLAQTSSISISLAVGDDIMQHLGKVTPLHHGFVEQAAFVVLKEPDVPSLLVETGFISNSREELQLRNPRHQEAIAKALMLGIKDYFDKHPPRGTFLSKGV